MKSSTDPWNPRWTSPFKRIKCPPGTRSVIMGEETSALRLLSRTCARILNKLEEVPTQGKDYGSEGISSVWVRPVIYL
ncbi:MAG TPA: hypothetical protein EYQ08_02020 [Planctomycetes bacterium]|nr:hypothetical protein [Planctomycetota bacterium]